MGQRKPNPGRNLPPAFNAAASILKDALSEKLSLQLLEDMVTDFDDVSNAQQADALDILEETIATIALNDASTACHAALQAHNHIPAFQQRAAEIIGKCLDTLLIKDSRGALKTTLLVLHTSDETTPASKAACERLVSFAVTETLMCGSAIETRKIIRLGLEEKIKDQRYKDLMLEVQDKLYIFCPYHADDTDNSPRLEIP